MIKYILFDFDGTLVDSKQVFISTFNKLANKYNFKKIEHTNLDIIKRLSMMQRFRYLNIPLYKVPFLTKEFLALYKLELSSLSLVAGMEPVFQRIGELGLEIGIVSSNSVDTIKKFLDHNSIPGISEVHCSGRLFGKERLLQKFLKYKNLHSSEVLYVCDELRDILACKKAQIKPIWVSWGFEVQEVVGESQHLLYSAHTPQELVAIIEREHAQLS